jgi:chaperonin GroES
LAVDSPKKRFIEGVRDQKPSLMKIGRMNPMATATKTKTRLKLQPLGDRVVVEREDAEKTTSGGIVLPDTAKDKPARGTVVSVGDGRLLDDGSRSKLQVKKGDRVIFNSYAGETFRVGDDELLLMREDEILAVIES